jgi:hypothetical protein
MVRTIVLVVALFSMNGARATPTSEPNASRAISDAVLRGVWSHCPLVKLEKGNGATYIATGPDRRVGVVGVDRCEVSTDKGKTTFSVGVTITVRDPTSNETLAIIERGDDVDNVGSCDEARARALKGSIASPNLRICTEGFHPLEPQPLDFIAMLHPALSPHGPVSFSDDGLGWAVQGRTLRVVGTTTCAPVDRVLERGMRGEGIQPWRITTRADVLEVAKTFTSKVTQLNVSTVGLGISCDSALTNRRKFDAELKKAVDAVVTSLQPATTPAP